MSSRFEAIWQDDNDSRRAILQTREVELAGQKRLRVESEFVEASGTDPDTVINRMFEELDSRICTLPSVADEVAVDRMFREIDAAIPNIVPARPQPIGPFLLKPNSDDATICGAIQRNIGSPNVVVRPL